jgi:N-hydroxyarylamine O-acetyltransferase
LEKGLWTLQYSFTTEPKILEDFSTMCDFQQDSPASHFRTRMVCTKATEKGRITLSDNSLIVREGKEKVKTELKSQEEFNKYLFEHFEIKFDD